MEAGGGIMIEAGGGIAGIEAGGATVGLEAGGTTVGMEAGGTTVGMEATGRAATRRCRRGRPCWEVDDLVVVMEGPFWSSPCVATSADLKLEMRTRNDGHKWLRTDQYRELETSPDQQVVCLGDPPTLRAS